VAVFLGFRFSLPGPDGEAKPFVLKGGLDGYIAIAVTLGLALGTVLLIYGVVQIASPQA
jgi:hypothetical protein